MITYNILLIDFEGIIILRTKNFRKNIIFIKKQTPLCSFSSRCVNTKNSDKTGQTTLNFFALELATVVNQAHSFRFNGDAQNFVIQQN